MMVRLVIAPSGELAVDMAGSSFGRGAHVHAQADCLAKACKDGRFSRAFKANVKTAVSDLAGQIVEACDRRMTGLLAAARRASAVALGADSACEAIDDGAPAVIVATDAGKVAQKVSIVNAVAEGRAIAWNDKVGLGVILGRDEVAVCAVRDARIAKELVSMMSVRSRCFACRSEVR